MDFSSPGFSIHGISQTRILEWVAISFSRYSRLTHHQFLCYNVATCYHFFFFFSFLWKRICVLCTHCWGTELFSFDFLDWHLFSICPETMEAIQPLNAECCFVLLFICQWSKNHCYVVLFPATISACLQLILWIQSTLECSNFWTCQIHLTLFLT